MPEDQRSKVKAALSWLAKAVRSFHLYPSESSAYSQILAALHKSLQKLLAQEGELELGVGQFGFSFQGELVYEERDRATSVAFRLYRDGIRSLYFTEGVEREELLGFLEVLAKELHPDDLEDDLLTMLWQKDFVHISYEYVEEPFNEEGVTAFLSQPLAPANESESVDQPEAGVSPALSLDQELVGVVKDETTVERAIEELGQRDIFGRLLDILLELLPYIEDEETFSQVAAKIRQVIALLVTRGQFSRPRAALARVRNSPQLTLDKIEIVDREWAKLADKDIIYQLAPYLEDNSAKFSAAEQFLRGLGSDLVPLLCDLLPALETGNGLASFLVEPSGENLKPFIERMAGEDWRLVKWMVRILGLKRDSQALRHFSLALSHPEEQVRREAIKALTHFPPEKTASHLLAALGDTNHQVRILTLGIIERSNYSGFTDALKKLLARRDFSERPTLEKKLVFSALGRLKGDSVPPLFQRILASRSWFDREEREKMKVYAALGLEAVGTEKAAEILEQYQDARHIPLTDACQAALRRLRKGTKQSYDH
ncbi:MAG: HEAT repeat domain-containing protein [Thermodesulfobacteriota bacterium]